MYKVELNFGQMNAVENAVDAYIVECEKNIAKCRDLEIDPSFWVAQVTELKKSAEILENTKSFVS